MREGGGDPLRGGWPPKLGGRRRDTPPLKGSVAPPTSKEVERGNSPSGAGNADPPTTIKSLGAFPPQPQGSPFY